MMRKLKARSATPRSTPRSWKSNQAQWKRERTAKHKRTYSSSGCRFINFGSVNYKQLMEIFFTLQENDKQQLANILPHMDTIYKEMLIFGMSPAEKQFLQYQLQIRRLFLQYHLQIRRLFCILNFMKDVKDSFWFPSPWLLFVIFISVSWY